MNLFEFFREKQIRITPELQVTARCISARDTTDLYALADGDLLLVKRLLTAQDVKWLLSYRENCTVFTMKPDSLAALDAQNELRIAVKVNYLDSIGLNYMHFGETLLVFGSFPKEQPETAVPNAICISPVHRSDIETQLAINLDTLMKALGLTETTGTEIADESESADVSDVQSESSKTPTEIDLVRAALKEEFERQYSVVKAEFSGVSFEKKTISLSGFYQKHGIAKGRLKGNWRLFEKETLCEIMDEGIVGKARDAMFRRYSVSIPGYGRIVRTKDIEAFRAELDRIAADYRRYLNGDNGCISIGEIPISKPFSPQDAIGDSLYALLEYLIEICPAKGLETEKYIQDAKDFVDEAYKELDTFSEQVHLRMTEASYRDNQWKERDFVDCFWRAISTDREFFNDRFVALLERYSKLLYTEVKE